MKIYRLIPCVLLAYYIKVVDNEYIGNDLVSRQFVYRNADTSFHYFVHNERLPEGMYLTHFSMYVHRTSLLQRFSRALFLRNSCITLYLFKKINDFFPRFEILWEMELCSTASDEVVEIPVQPVVEITERNYFGWRCPPTGDPCLVSVASQTFQYLLYNTGPDANVGDFVSIGRPFNQVWSIGVTIEDDVQPKTTAEIELDTTHLVETTEATIQPTTKPTTQPTSEQTTQPTTEQDSTTSTTLSASSTTNSTSSATNSTSSTSSTATEQGDTSPTSEFPRSPQPTSEDDYNSSIDVTIATTEPVPPVPPPLALYVVPSLIGLSIIAVLLLVLLWWCRQRNLKRVSPRKTEFPTYPSPITALYDEIDSTTWKQFPLQYHTPVSELYRSEQTQKHKRKRKSSAKTHPPSSVIDEENANNTANVKIGAETGALSGAGAGTGARTGAVGLGSGAEIITPEQVELLDRESKQCTINK